MICNGAERENNYEWKCTQVKKYVFLFGFDPAMTNYAAREKKNTGTHDYAAPCRILPRDHRICEFRHQSQSREIYSNFKKRRTVVTRYRPSELPSQQRGGETIQWQIARRTYKTEKNEKQQRKYAIRKRRSHEHVGSGVGANGDRLKLAA
jgi:hypothetical protein